MIEIRLDDSELQKGLSQLLRNARNTAPMMRGIAEELHNATKDNFANEAWGSEKWPQSKATAKRKGKTLYKSGELHDSITTQVGHSFARIGSNLKYAAIHHLGGRAGRNKTITLPARPYLPIRGDGQIQKEAQDNILQVVLDSLSGGMK